MATTRRHYKGKVYETHLLRRSFREGGKVKNETVGNLSHLPPELIEFIRQALKGETFLPAGEGFKISRSLPHGHLAAAYLMAKKLGLPELLGPRGPERDLAWALILLRVVRPASKLASTRLLSDTALACDLDLAGAGTDEAYAALDFLLGEQARIETTLAKRHLAPGSLVLYDLSSSYLEGRHCPLAAYGYSRDGRRGQLQITYGVVSDKEGCPVAVEVFPGNTADPVAFTACVKKVKERFGLERVVLVGDRGMITSTRIEALRSEAGLGFITALRAPELTALAAGGYLQLSLFDQASLAEITHPDYPGERLVVCRNPALAAERARKRAELLAATEAELRRLQSQVEAGRLKSPEKIGLRLGQVLERSVVGKHFHFHIGAGHFAFERKEAQIAAEAAVDGLYVVRTSVQVQELAAPEVVEAYKGLSRVERAFPSLKTVDLEVHPVFHRLEERVRAHVFLCLLAYYLTFHLRKAFAPLFFTDEEPPVREDPVGKARRSEDAERKAARKKTSEGQPVHSFATLLAHLATLTRNTIRLPGQEVAYEQLSEPTETQRRAFELLGSPVPLQLK